MPGRTLKIPCLELANGSLQAEPAQAQRSARVHAGEIQGCQRQYPQRSRSVVRQELAEEDPERNQRPPARTAREQQRHDHSGIRIPRSDACVAQRFDVARPIQQQIKREVACAEEQGL